MTISLVSTPGELRVLVTGARELFAASAAIELPDGCAYRALRPGTLLESRGSPLAIAGPRADGAILAASSLRRRMESVSGDGTLLVLAIDGACAAPARILEATSFAMDGTATPLPVVPELPGSGPGGLLVLAGLLCATMLAWLRSPNTGSTTGCVSSSSAVPPSTRSSWRTSSRAAPSTSAPLRTA